MHLLQREKKASLFQNNRISRITLAFTLMLLFSAALSLSGQAGVAHAASSASVIPASVHGGGCNSNGALEACISVNSSGQVVPDVYVVIPYPNEVCNIKIALYKDGSQYNVDNTNNCYKNGAHLYGFSTEAVSGHSWFTHAQGIVPSGYSPSVNSPLQYT